MRVPEGHHKVVHRGDVFDEEIEVDSHDASLLLLLRAPSHQREEVVGELRSRNLGESVRFKFRFSLFKCLAWPLLAPNHSGYLGPDILNLDSFEVGDRPEGGHQVFVGDQATKGERERLELFPK